MSATEQGCGIFTIGDARLGIPITFLGEVCWIPSLLPFPFDRDGVIGTFDLRGTFVPILDLAILARLGDPVATPRLAAILRHDGRMLGIAIDRVEGIARPPRGAVQDFALGDEAGALIATGFRDDAGAVSLLDVARLFAQSRMPSAPQSRAHVDAKSDRDSTTFLSFRAGGADFAIDALKVISTVPRRAIETAEMASGPCLGHVEHHGWKIPVVETCSVLGVGRGAPRSTPEIVVVSGPDQSRLGLAVDSISMVTRIANDVLIPSSPVLARHGLIPEVIVRDSEHPTHVVDGDALLADPVMARLASLSLAKDVAGSADTGPARGAGAGTGPGAGGQSGAVGMGERYLVFEAGQRIATPAQEVVCVVDPPRTLIPANEAGSRWTGLFVHDGSTVPLVDLCPEGALPAFVLIMGERGRRVGFAVQSVVGIQRARWTSPAGKPDAENYVELREGDATTICHRMSLSDLAGEIAA